MVLVILTLLISGGRQLRHLLYLDGDPLVLPLCGVERVPTLRRIGRWLSAFRARHLPRLQWVNALVVARALTPPPPAELISSQGFPPLRAA